MSVLSVNSIGSRIATQIRQASFDPFGIESNMYMGEQVVAMYAYDIKPSSWSQISWCNLGGCGGNGSSVGGDIDSLVSGGGFVFPISGREYGVAKSFDYLLAVAIEAVFPQITLVNTAAPTPYTITVPSQVEGPPVTSPLYYYVSTGAFGLAAGTIYVGTLASLTSGSTGLGVPITEVFPFVSFTPRHIVSWSQYALLAAIEFITLRVNGVDYEPMDRNALFNALQFRTREDVFPVAVEQATSFRAQQVSATVGLGPSAILGSLAEDGRYKAFTVPFSFTTSALADRGQNGKHLSAFPLLLCCESGVCVDVRTVGDLREILVLQEEQLVDVGTSPVVVVSAGRPTGAIVINSTTVSYSFAAGAFTVPLNVVTGVFGTAPLTSVTITPASTGIPTTVTFNPLTLSALGATFLQQTGDYLPVTRYSTNHPNAALGTVVDYADWIVETDPRLRVSARALGATVTDLERGMMKADCRNKKFLYEAYAYACDRFVAPGSQHCVSLIRTPGQFKYAYTFAENETSRLQGQFFNFTNSTEFVVVIDDDLMGTKFIFDGYDSCRYFSTRIGGYDDFAARSKFLRYVDNPLFAQRAPRVKGLHIIPRYANWINSIYPDGSVNLETMSDAVVRVSTTPSATTSVPTSANCGLPNTIAYNLSAIEVLWRIALFELGA
jgi:hypothetical protein